MIHFKNKFIILNKYETARLHLCAKDYSILTEAIKVNTTLKKLSILCLLSINYCTIIILYFWWLSDARRIDENSAIVLADALKVNTTLHTFGLSCKKIMV